MIKAEPTVISLLLLLSSRLLLSHSLAPPTSPKAHPTKLFHSRSSSEDVPSKRIDHPQPYHHHHLPTILKNRRSTLSHLLLFPFLLLLPSPTFATINESTIPPNSILTIQLQTPQNKFGLELIDVQIGTNPPQTYPAIQSVRFRGEGIKQGAQPGMIVLNFPTARSISERVQNGPYPIRLDLYNLALGGDAIGDLGRPIVSAMDALEAARSNSGSSSSGSRANVDGKKAPTSEQAQQQSLGGSSGARGGGAATTTAAADLSKSSSSSATTTTNGGGGGSGLIIRQIRPASGLCAIQSRRFDTLEINYEARAGVTLDTSSSTGTISSRGYVYDSSYQRGTGQPYQFQLGNGDVLPGVDLGLYDMCPGEIREIIIPPLLGYGTKGNKLFGIGTDETLVWVVELVRLNFISEGMNTVERDGLYQGGSGTLPEY